MDSFRNSSEGSDQDDNRDSSSFPKKFQDCNGSLPQKRRWRTFESYLGEPGSLSKIVSGGKRKTISQSPNSGLLDHAGSIGEAISKVIATSKRQLQKDMSSSGRNSAKIGEGELGKYEGIIKSLECYTIRKYISEKAILRWHEIMISYNKTARDLGDYWHWKKYLSTIFCKNSSFRVVQECNGDQKYFNFCFPVLCAMWESLRYSGQVGLEVRPSRVRAQVLSNGSIIIEDQNCYHNSRWEDGSSLGCKVHIRASLGLNFMIQWIEFRFTSTSPIIDWYSLDKMLQASMSNPQKMDVFMRLINSARMLGAEETSPFGTADSGLSLSNFNNGVAVRELQFHIDAFKNLSDASKHQEIDKTSQLTEVMSSLTDLLLYQKETQIVSPLEALDKYVKLYKNSTERLSKEVTSNNKHAENNVVSSDSPNDPIADAFTISLLNESDEVSKTKEFTKRTKNFEIPSSLTPSSSLRSSSLRISKDEIVGDNSIPGTKKIRF